MLVVMRRTKRLLLEPFWLLWGLYAWVVFSLFALLAAIAMPILPGLERRRRAARAIARGIFVAIGAKPRVTGTMPTPPCVVIANHASFVDGVLLTAVLPAEFAFVVKQEMAKVPLAGLLLSRIGSHYVDRFNSHMGAMAMRRLMRAAEYGEALVFFPEGTFGRDPGLRRFHSGAFVTALRGELPVWPVVIRGTRRMLPAGRLLPLPARLEVQVLPPITAGAEATVERLRSATRQRILAVLGEPDLEAAQRA